VPPPLQASVSESAMSAVTEPELPLPASFDGEGLKINYFYLKLIKHFFYFCISAIIYNCFFVLGVSRFSVYFKELLLEIQC
jgi:hypothetical protein